MKKNRVLLVDDDADILTVFREGLESRGFEVVTASTVIQALNLISTEKFDVLLSDLHMPDAGDGFTVVSAMRHTHPNAVTIVVSGYPALQEAMAAVLLQADEVLVKPVSFGEISNLIESKLANPGAHLALSKERVGAILERGTGRTIENWLSRVERHKELTTIALNDEERTGHLPQLMGDLVNRLRLAPNGTIPVSTSAYRHGTLRREQGYTVSMMVEESRMLQVSIFNTLQNNLGSVDFSTVLLDVMTIADEVDSQLKQAVLGFIEPATVKAVSQTI